MTRDRVLAAAVSIRLPRDVVGYGRAAVLALILLLTGGTLSSCAVTPAVPQSVVTTPVTITPQRDWSDAILYFVIVDRFADGDTTNNLHLDRRNPGGFHGGDLKGLTAQLDEIAGLGVTAIWITPVVRQIDHPVWAQGPAATGTSGGFEHWPFHGYWADDFTQMDAHFGSEEDLRAFVTAAHQRGLKVLLDVVYNHSGYGSRYTTDPRFHDWVRHTDVGCETDPTRCQVGGLPDFKTELAVVRDYLFAASLGLAKRTSLDGFRLDTVKHVEHDFWQAQRHLTRQQLGKDFFLLGEVWGGSNRVLDEWFAGDEMDAGFDFTFKGSCQAFVNGAGRTVAFAHYLSKRHELRQGYFLAHYLSSHDEPMALYGVGGDKQRFKLCVALQMTVLGIPVIYYGEEVGREGSVWPTNRKDMPWGTRPIPPGKGVVRDESLRAYYQRLIQLRRAHIALSAGTFRAVSSDGDLLVFAREHAGSGDAVMVAINRGTQRAQATVPRPSAWKGAKVRGGLSGSVFDAAGDSLHIDLPPVSAEIYVPAT
jgi:alpha-amylase